MSRPCLIKQWAGQPIAAELPGPSFPGYSGTGPDVPAIPNQAVGRPADRGRGVATLVRADRRQAGRRRSPAPLRHGRRERAHADPWSAVLSELSPPGLDPRERAQRRVNALTGSASAKISRPGRGVRPPRRSQAGTQPARGRSEAGRAEPSAPEGQSEEMRRDRRHRWINITGTPPTNPNASRPSGNVSFTKAPYGSARPNDRPGRPHLRGTQAGPIRREDDLKRGQVEPPR
jgi:hypothetical protein